MVQPNREWRVSPQLEPAPGLVLLYLALLVAAQTALSRHQGTHLEEPACAESRVWIRHWLLRFACGPRGPLDNQQGSRLVCPPHIGTPPSWDLSNPTCLTLVEKRDQSRRSIGSGLCPSHELAVAHGLAFIFWCI